MIGSKPDKHTSTCTAKQYHEVVAWAAEQHSSNRKRKNGEPRFRGKHRERCVYLRHSDRSYFVWCSAFFVKKKGCIAVFTEHHGHHVYPIDEVDYFGYVEEGDVT